MNDRVRDGRHLMNLAARYRHLAMLREECAKLEALRPRRPYIVAMGRVIADADGRFIAPPIPKSLQLERRLAARKPWNETGCVNVDTWEPHLDSCPCESCQRVQRTMKQ